MSRLFVAAYPDATASAVLDALPRPDEPGVRWVPSANRHVTLRFLGEADPAAAAVALRDLDGSVATATTAGPVGRLGRDALVVPIGGLDGLAAGVARATEGLGRPAGPGFIGHLTLARLRGRAACGLTNRHVTLRWDVSEVCLVESELRSDGAVHTILERYPLASRAAEAGDGPAN